MIVNGINVVNELLNASSQIDKIIAEKCDNRDVLKIIERAEKKGIRVDIVSRQDLERIAKGKTQGVIAFVPNFRYSDLDEVLREIEINNKPAFLVILDSIEDPHNLGAIIRTSECAGVDAVIIPENRACDITDTVYRTSAGAVTHMPVVKVTNLARTVRTLKEHGIWTYALEAGSKRVYESDFTYPTALVIGSEGKGVSRLVKENVDEILSLDMYGKVNSLNASCAGAIAIYEVVRQRRK